MRTVFKLLWAAGIAGVAAGGAVMARNERERQHYGPDEIRERLHARHDEAMARQAEADEAAAAQAAAEAAAEVQPD